MVVKENCILYSDLAKSSRIVKSPSSFNQTNWNYALITEDYPSASEGKLENHKLPNFTFKYSEVLIFSSAFDHQHPFLSF